MPTEPSARSVWRSSWRWFWRCAAALLMVGTVIGVRAQSLESVLAPGPVIQGHAKVEHECKACHARFDRAGQDALCISCHKEVGSDVKDGHGLHGKRDAKQQCRACHTEHKGRAAQLVNFDSKTFDHQHTDFDLHDKHVGVACAKCHAAGKRWAEAPSTCAACHGKDDVHKGGLGRQCADCHSAKSWKDARFDHDTKTRFALTDKHFSVKCDSCHAQGRYKDTPRTCIGCHRKDDTHKGNYGEKCESCHNARGWKPSTFNHDTETRYPLKDKHRQVKCASCHSGSLFNNKPGTDCVSCHLKDDKHKATLGTKCETCHSERSWKEPPGFDHDKSRFPLLGSHVKTACKDCHADALYRQTPSTCVACHRKADRHEGNLGERCETCHSAQKWKDVQGRFDHDRSRFPLRNAHAGRSVKCQDCHETLKAMRGTPTDCLSCHRRDDRHDGTLGAKCEACHQDSNWKVARYDHARTKFPLLGRHQVVACGACHLSLRFKDAGSTCIACHRKDDSHKATLGERCESCHNARAWSLWDFDHDRSTRYALEGRHRQTACKDCHTQPTPAGRAIAAVGSECVACHRKADVHEGRFGRRCETCHQPSNWRQVRQATAPRAGSAPR